ncbi:MAG: hypothetical protein J2P47_05855 [Acetobacteraceae bacterium]|nr:hypothetical protein [Acetobacteraceae bacterium]
MKPGRERRESIGVVLISASAGGTLIVIAIAIVFGWKAALTACILLLIALRLLVGHLMRSAIAAKTQLTTPDASRASEAAEPPRRAAPRALSVDRTRAINTPPEQDVPLPDRVPRNRSSRY